jgi:hypothetical protein
MIYDGLKTHASYPKEVEVEEESGSAYRFCYCDARTLFVSMATQPVN